MSLLFLIAHHGDLSIAVHPDLAPQVLNLRTGELYVLKPA